MIARLQGELARKNPDRLIVDAQGVGYLVHIPLSTFYSLPEAGERVRLNIHTHMAENIIRLYGFATQEELQVFELLISISKVGPKLALSVLSGISVQDLIDAVRDNNIDRLNTIPGVGRKTAERLALEIRDKLDRLTESSSLSKEGAPPSGNRAEALSALVNLGYKKSDAEKVLKRIGDSPEAPATLEDLIKESLKYLS